MFNVPLKVQYLENYDFEDWGKLKFAKPGDACFDLRTTDSVSILPGEIKIVGTGIKTEFDKNYVLHIYPRSGVACKMGITLANSPAVIDSGYRGEIKLCLINLTNQDVFISRGIRISQARLSCIVPTNIIMQSCLSSTDRGEGGLGSTGL